MNNTHKQVEAEFRTQYDELGLRPKKPTIKNLERELIIDYWRKALTLHEQAVQERVVEVLEGMRKVHREFECNGAHGGKGCYEDWCDMKTCTSADALACKEFNKALDNAITKIKEEV